MGKFSSSAGDFAVIFTGFGDVFATVECHGDQNMCFSSQKPKILWELPNPEVCHMPTFCQVAPVTCDMAQISARQVGL